MTAQIPERLHHAGREVAMTTMLNHNENWAIFGVDHTEI